MSDWMCYSNEFRGPRILPPRTCTHSIINEVWVSCEVARYMLIITGWRQAKAQTRHHPLLPCWQFPTKLLLHKPLQIVTARHLPEIKQTWVIIAVIAMLGGPLRLGFHPHFYRCAMRKPILVANCQQPLLLLLDCDLRIAILHPHWWFQTFWIWNRHRRLFSATPQTISQEGRRLPAAHF